MTHFSPRPGRRRFLLASATCLALASTFPVRGESRLKSATVMTGFAPGGSSDVLARLLAEHLRGRHADNMIVESKPGAGGRLAIEQVKNGPADGSQLLVSPTGMMVLFPHIYQDLRYDPLVDFAPVTPLAKFPFVLAISQRVPPDVTTLADFIAWCKANPDQASFGSPGAGTSAHFSGIMLGRSAGMAYTHVAYRGMVPLVQDLMGAQIASGVLTPVEALPLVESGRLRLIASTGAQRSPLLVGVPTYQESGHPDIVIEEFFSLYAPARLSPEVVAQLASQTQALLALPATHERFATMGLEPYPMQPDAFKAHLAALHQRWGDIVRDSGFEPTL